MLCLSASKIYSACDLIIANIQINAVAYFGTPSRSIIHQRIDYEPPQFGVGKTQQTFPVLWVFFPIQGMDVTDAQTVLIMQNIFFFGGGGIRLFFLKNNNKKLSCYSETWVCLCAESPFFFLKKKCNKASLRRHLLLWLDYITVKFQKQITQDMEGSETEEQINAK